MGPLPFACTLLTLLSWTALVAQATEHPNVLFLVVDDLRAELGCYGSSTVISPHLDRLAKRSLVLERAYCQQAICAPSRASVLTGTRPDTTKVWDLDTHFRDALPNVITLGQHFRQHGYFVQGFGKIFHPNLEDEPTWSVPWQSPAAPEYATKQSRTPYATFPPPKDPKKTRPTFAFPDVPDNTYRDGKVADLAIQTLQQLQAQQQAGKQPFFLAVGFAKPHLPFVAPKRYADLYSSKTIALASNPFRPRHSPAFAIDDGRELRNYRDIPEGPLPDELARQLRLAYYACISYIDAQIGRVLDELDRLDLTRNTIVILWSDHGWKLGEHQAWCKHSNMELDTRVPLMLSVPGHTEQGLRSRALVELVDIYPTLSELADLPLPSHLEGTSFAPLLDDPDRPWKKAAFSQYPRTTRKNKVYPLMGYSMRTDRYRYTRWVRDDESRETFARELYDHAVDPEENNNLAIEPDAKALLESLNRQMDGGWQAARPSPAPPQAPRELQQLRMRTTALDAFRMQSGVCLKDPSNIVRHNDRYWVLHAIYKDDETNTTIHAASSIDGTRWEPHGEVLSRGAAGVWDESGALAPYLVPHDGRYYLFYTGFRAANLATRQLGCAVADQPAGPWTRCSDQPVLNLPDDATAWDSGMLGDSNVVYFDGQWRLYYKGRRQTETSEETSVGVATADRITGPFQRHPRNPLFRGHAFSVWPHGDGVAAVRGVVSSTVMWSPDGIRFEDVGQWPNVSTGLFTPMDRSDPLHTHGFDWGLDELRTPEGVGLIRFDREATGPTPLPR